MYVPDANIVNVLTGILRSNDRNSESARVAKRFGAERLILFARDEVTQLPLPASGFPQTLPSGRRWLEFVKNAPEGQVARIRLPSPYTQVESDVAAVQDAEGTVLALIGGNPTDEVMLEVCHLLPLAGYTLRCEQKAKVYEAQVFQMKSEVGSARQLAKALDTVRRELETALDKASNETAVAEKARMDLLQANEQLALARDQALAASQAKSAFLASMSHELRTPLTAVIGYAEMLQDEAELPSTKADLGHIHNAGQHLLMLVNDILDMAKIEAGKAGATAENFKIMQVLQEAAEVIAPQASMQDNRVIVKEPGELPEMHTDRTKLRQIVLNLLSNAAKFTHNGTITVSTKLSDAGENVQIAISDTGTGIPSSELQNIFTEFTQLKTETVHKTPGTGLGLSICRRLCHLLGGEIYVKSTPGLGSTFTIEIPVNLR